MITFSACSRVSPSASSDVMVPSAVTTQTAPPVTATSRMEAAEANDVFASSFMSQQPAAEAAADSRMTALLSKQ